MPGNSEVDEDLQQNMHQVLTFRISNETYGINILNIREIIEYDGLTPVPMMPKFIEGVINLRGSIVPVVNLSLRLGLEPAGVTKRTSVVIIEVMSAETQEHLDIGITVDLVNEVIDIPTENLSIAPSFGANIRTDFIEMMARIEEKFLVVLDVNCVLSVEELSLIDGLQTQTDAEHHARPQTIPSSQLQ